MKARDVMSAHRVWACAETSNVRNVAEMMADHNVGSIPVLDDEGRLEGIVTDRDLCCHVIAMGRSSTLLVREIMSEPVQTVHPDASLEEIESLMRQYRIRRLPVVDDDMRLQGFISIGDLACHCAGPTEEHELVSVLEKVSGPARL